MINLQFFPSRRIALYMARLFVTRSLAVLVALVAILMMLDLLGNSGEILAHPGNGDAELWRYVGLRIPQLVARFLPFAVLLGTLITLAGLNQHSEIISMKAAGISAHQIIAPLILAAAIVAIAHFAFIERVVTRANAALSAWDAVEYGPIPEGDRRPQQHRHRPWRRPHLRPPGHRPGRGCPAGRNQHLRPPRRHAAAHPERRDAAATPRPAAGNSRTRPCSTSTAAGCSAWAG